MNKIPFHVVVECITTFLNQDDRFVFLARVKKSWRNGSQRTRAKILSLDNGPDASPIAFDRSVISFIKLQIRTYEVSEQLYGHISCMLVEDDKPTFRNMRRHVSGCSQIIQQTCIDTFGERKTLERLQADWNVSFSNPNGERFVEDTEDMFVARYISAKGVVEPQRSLPSIRVTHSPLIPSSSWLTSPEESVLSHMEGYVKKFRAICDALRMWEVYTHDLVRFGVPPDKAKQHLDIVAFVTPRLRHPLVIDPYKLSDCKRQSLRNLTHEQKARYRRVIESISAHDQTIADTLTKRVFPLPPIT